MRLVVVAVLTISLAAGAAAARANDWEDQLEFGAKMAERGLWAEAFFRFERADRLHPNHARTLSNLAVASEALGRFDDAQEYYRRALEIRPSDREIRGNYDRFLGFYESYRARQEQPRQDSAEPTASSPAAPTADEPAADAPAEAETGSTTDPGEGQP
jgi:Tfp pilus assembly protein PilF